MADYVSRHDVSNSFNENKKTAKTLEDVLKKIIKSGRKIDNQVKICFEDGAKKSEKIVDATNTESAFNPEQKRQFQKVLENPQEFKGRVTIFVGTEKIFDVQNGQVKTDELNLISKEQKQTIEAKEEVSIEFRNDDRLVENTKELVKLLRRLDNVAPGDYKPFSDQNYFYWEKDGEVKITSINNKKELLNNQGLTKEATPDDVERFGWIEECISRLRGMEEEQMHKQILENAPKISM